MHRVADASAQSVPATRMVADDDHVEHALEPRSRYRIEQGLQAQQTGEQYGVLADNKHDASPASFLVPRLFGEKRLRSR
jgi:hypothetical protein